MTIDNLFSGQLGDKKQENDMNPIAALFLLPIKQRLTPELSVRQQDELDILVIDAPLCRAAIALQGAHLLSWQPLGESEPVLWLSGNTRFKQGIPIRGGVPICWPWFTNLGGEPFHGFARIFHWQLSNYQFDEQQIELKLSLIDSKESRRIWPHAFHLSVYFTFSHKACQIMLEVRGNFSVTAALHSYFNVGNIHNVTLYDTGTLCQDTLSSRTKEIPAKPWLVSGETSFIFTNPPEKTQLHDSVFERVITVTHENNSDVVVWNPWIKRAAEIADMPNDGWETMLCIETACISLPLVSRQDEASELGVRFQLI